MKNERLKKIHSSTQMKWFFSDILHQIIVKYTVRKILQIVVRILMQSFIKNCVVHQTFLSLKFARLFGIIDFTEIHKVYLFYYKNE